MVTISEPARINFCFSFIEERSGPKIVRFGVLTSVMPLYNARYFIARPYSNSAPRHLPGRITVIYLFGVILSQT